MGFELGTGSCCGGEMCACICAGLYRVALKSPPFLAALFFLFPSLNLIL